MSSKEVEKNKAPVPSEAPVIVVLKKPVRFGAEDITEVVLQPLTGRHIRGMSAKPSIDELLRVAAKASGLSDKVFDMMSAKDIQAVLEAVGEAL
jgi:hypothetical protein